MIPDIGALPAPYLLLLALVAALILAVRVPLLRRLLSLVTLVGLGAMLAIMVDQRVRFDPYLERFASILRPDPQEVTGKETRIRMSRDGHFWARVTIDGVDRRMLVDSGATITALSTGTATAAGLAMRDEVFPVILKTANGTVEAQTSTVAELRFGNIVARDLAVVVSPGLGGTDVLGMNFLSRLKSWRVEDATLILTPHHPQPASRG